MEIFGRYAFEPQALLRAKKCYGHVQNFLREGLVQVSSDDRGRHLTAYGSAGPLTIVKLELGEEAFVPATAPDGDAGEAAAPGPVRATACFRNTSAGKTFVCTRELFGEGLVGADVTLYGRPGGGTVEFVETHLRYQNLSRTSHTAVVRSGLPPVDSQSARIGLVGRAVLTHKTCASLQRWLRAQIKLRGKVAGPVELDAVVCADMHAVTFAVGENCLTVEVAPLPGPVSTMTLKPVRPARDEGILEMTTVFKLDAAGFLNALTACKIPGYSLPILEFFISGCVEVTPHKLRADADPARLVVILLGIGGSEASRASSLSEASPALDSQTLAEAPGPGSAPGGVAAPSPVPAPEPAPETEPESEPEPAPRTPRGESGTAYETPTSSPGAPHRGRPAPGPRERRHSGLRKRSGSSKSRSSKKLKLVFNPLV